jgi:hypothetical protein
MPITQFLHRGVRIEQLPVVVTDGGGHVPTPLLLTLGRPTNHKVPLRRIT